MGMHVKNSTRYSGVMLRSVFLAVVNHVEKTLARSRGERAMASRAAFIRAHCEIEYVYTRNRSCSGRASLNGGWTRIRIHRDEVRLATLCWLVQHEVWHLFGLGHDQMPHAVTRWSEAGDAASAEHYAELIARYGEVVREEPAPVTELVPTNVKQARKLASIIERTARWESKRKRAETALKKLKKQQRYYETQLAAAKGPPS